jgi:5-aminolevulinate synthase
MQHHAYKESNTSSSSTTTTAACTNTINCPFFRNSGLTDASLNKLIRRLPNQPQRGGNGDIIATSFMQMSKKPATAKCTRPKETAKDEEQTEASAKSLFDYDRFFGGQIAAKKRDGSYRYFKKVVREAATFPQVHEHIEATGQLRPVTIWCSNDYLVRNFFFFFLLIVTYLTQLKKKKGLGTHPYVQGKVCEAVTMYGAGSGGTRNISGSTPLHVQLESELATLHQQEAALLFTSCYVANDTTLYTLAKLLASKQHPCHIVSDEGNHASMIQGIRNSGMPKHIFKVKEIHILGDGLIFLDVFFFCKKGKICPRKLDFSRIFFFMKKMG